MADDRAFPWAATLDADQLSAFIDDLWGAASGDDDLATLDAIEKAIAAHRPDPVPDLLCPITGREAEILSELANGLTYDRAAYAVGISRHTVRRVASTIFSKLGALNGTQAAAIAAHHGWLPGLRLPDSPAPVAARGAHTWRALYRESAARMREQPGTTVDIGPYTTLTSARVAARRINKGLLPQFSPAGSFKARHTRASDRDRRWIVAARYVGEPTSTTEGDPS